MSGDVVKSIKYFFILVPGKKENRNRKWEVSSLIYPFGHLMLKDFPFFLNMGKLSNDDSLFREFFHFPRPQPSACMKWLGGAVAGPVLPSLVCPDQHLFYILPDARNP